MPKRIPDLLKDRDKRTAKRKMDKKAWDAQFDLAADSKKSIRLLDEGMVTYSDGSPLFYIKKGTLSKLVENMKDEYVGSINLGHMDFARFPFILGTWKKKDLTLVDIGDGRQALEVVPHFDTDSLFIKELKRLPYDVAVSAEFRSHRDWELSQRYGVEVVDEIYPEGFNFAIVGEPGNVNSAGVRLALKGEDMTLEELSAAIESHETTSLADLSALLEVEEENPLETLEAEETPEEETHEELSEEAHEELPEETSEEASVEAAEAPDEVSEGEAEEDTLASVEEAVDALRSENEELRRQVEELTAQVASLTSERDSANEALTASRNELAAAREAEKDFIAKFKKIKLVSTNEPKKHEPKAPKASYTDGFGE